MSRNLLKSIVFTVIAIFSCKCINAQQAEKANNSSNADYKASIGVGFDFLEDQTATGPSFKFFLSRHNAIKLEALFNKDFTTTSFFYQYHGNFPDVTGLKITFGFGISKIFNKHSDDPFVFGPTTGLDLKVPKIPLNLEVEWRPSVFTYNDGDGSGGGTFSRFGVGLRYCL